MYGLQFFIYAQKWHVDGVVFSHLLSKVSTLPLKYIDSKDNVVYNSKGAACLSSIRWSRRRCKRIVVYMDM